MNMFIFCSCGPFYRHLVFMFCFVCHVRVPCKLHVRVCCHNSGTPTDRLSVCLHVMLVVLLQHFLFTPLLFFSQGRCLDMSCLRTNSNSILSKIAPPLSRRGGLFISPLHTTLLVVFTCTPLLAVLYAASSQSLHNQAVLNSVIRRSPSNLFRPDLLSCRVRPPDQIGRKSLPRIHPTPLFSTRLI